MKLRDLIGVLVMASAVYTVGPFTVTAQTPSIPFQSSSSGDFAWFTWLSKFEGQKECLRIYKGADSTDPATADIHGYTSNNGTAFSVSPTRYAGGGDGPWMQAPLLLSEGGIVSGLPRGAARGLAGKVIGAGYLVTGTGSTTLHGDFVELQDGGKTYYRRDGAITITGLPRVLSGPYALWYSDIIVVSTNRWLSNLYLKMGGDSIFSVITIECTDGKGLAWAYVGTPFPAATVTSDQGASESSLVLLSGGEIMCVARVDTWNASTNLARAFSSDYGRTWGSIDRITGCGRVAPRAWRLAGTGDIAIVTGDTHGGGGIALGCWLSTDAHGNTWNKFDMLAHHNVSFTDPALQIPAGGGSTAYDGLVELEPNRLLVSYDRSRGAYGMDSSVNSVFTVDFTITR